MKITDFFEEENSETKPVVSERTIIDKTVRGQPIPKKMALFNRKTKQILTDEHGDVILFSTNTEASMYCQENKLSGYLCDNINPKLRCALLQ